MKMDATHKNLKITDAKIIEIQKRFETGEKIIDMCSEAGITRTTFYLRVHKAIADRKPRAKLPVSSRPERLLCESTRRLRKQIAQLAGKGHGCGAISSKLGVSNSLVRYHAAQAGIVLNDGRRKYTPKMYFDIKRLVDGGMTISAATKLHNTSAMTFWRLSKKFDKQ